MAVWREEVCSRALVDPVLSDVCNIGRLQPQRRKELGYLLLGQVGKKKDARIDLM
jgi:hypothetical protein